MGVLDFALKSRFPYAGGQQFGDAGAYEQIDGVLTFSADPESPANELIVDLKLAPRDSNGRVIYKADFTLVQPVDPARGSGTLVVELPNRGRRRVIDTFNRTHAAESASPPPGDGFLFNRGYSVASIGWQWDVYRDDALMGLEPPMADISAEDDPGQNVVEIRPYFPAKTWLLADRIHRPMKVANLDDPNAVLYVKDYEDGEAEVVPREEWRFAQETPDGISPSDEHIYLEAGFEPGKYYQVVYSTREAPVAGTGLLAFRDVATFLRYDATGLVAGGFDNVVGYGVSQTGRFIRHFLHLGLNTDELGRKAYDGLLPHVAGARMGAFNHRYAQPSNQSYPNWGHLFPFADSELNDPLTGQRDGLLKRVRESGNAPKVIYTNSSAEYWRGDSSLLSTDVLGGMDLESEADSRIYHFAGTQHGPGTLPQTGEGASEGALGARLFNVVDYTPLLRAALVNLVDWVANGKEPPPNRHPRISDGSAISRGEVNRTFERLPQQVTADPDKMWVMRTIDLGSRQAEGVGVYPPVEGAAYPCLVSAVDEDGNEVAGIRLPDVSVPVATHTGWNTRAPETGAPDQQIPMQGFSRWFASTRAERGASGDPRLSIKERYSSRDEYARLVREAASELIRDGYVLPEDLELVAQNAIARYDYALELAKRSAMAD